jgi:exonuclease III
MANMCITSLNVRGINEISKRNTVYTWIKENKYDICFLQETYCTEAAKTQFDKQWKGDVFHSVSNSSHSRGVCILLSSNLTYNIISSHTDNEGRMVLVNLEIDGNEYTLVNIYAPNKVFDRISFFKNMTRFITEYALNKNRLFIGGDFNCVLTASDRSSGKTDKSMNVLKELVKTYSLVDVWKDFNPNRKEYTFIDSSFRMRNSRIDYIFCSRSIKSLCVSSSICQAPAPDHKAVCLHFRTSINTRGKGYWKFNNSVLNDEAFVCGVKEMYLNIVFEYGD